MSRNTNTSCMFGYMCLSLRKATSKRSSCRVKDRLIKRLMMENRKTKYVSLLKNKKPSVYVCRYLYQTYPWGKQNRENIP